MFSAISYAVDDFGDNPVFFDIWDRGDNVCQYVGTASTAESGMSRICKLTTCIQPFMSVAHRQDFDNHSEHFSLTLIDSPIHLRSRLSSQAYLTPHTLGQRTEDAQAHDKHPRHWTSPLCQRSITYSYRPRQRKHKSKSRLDVHVSGQHESNEAIQGLHRSNRNDRQNYTRRPSDQKASSDHKVDPLSHEHHRNLSNLHTIRPNHNSQPAQYETQLPNPPTGPFMSGALDARDQRPGQLHVNMFQDRLGRWHERRPADAGRNMSTAERAATEKSSRVEQRVSGDSDIEEIPRPEMTAWRHRKRPLRRRFIDEVTWVF